LPGPRGRGTGPRRSGISRNSLVRHKAGGLVASGCSKRKLLSSEALQEPTSADAGEFATPNFGEFTFHALG
jgi:hypothetical protein